MLCSELVMATEILLATMRHSTLPVLYLNADKALVQMTIDNFHIPYEITREINGVVQIRKTK